MKANKGEWSEFYAFLKILSDKQIPAADKNLEVIKDKFFVFQKVFRPDNAFKFKRNFARKIRLVLF